METNDRTESSVSDDSQSVLRQTSPPRGNGWTEDGLTPEYLQKIFSMPLLERERELE